MIRSTDEIYPTVTEALSKSTKPMTCADLMAVPTVFNAALNRWGQDKVKASEKLSDTLGFMWRRGVLDRFPAPPSLSMARYAYAIAGKFDHIGEPITPPLTKHKGDLTVVEKDGEVIIEMKNFTIVVKPK
jgi:hypothetical protein